MKLGKLKQILNEADIHYVSDQPNSGGWLACTCPFAPWTHERGTDRHGSFFIKVDSPKRTAGHCFTCKEKGNLGNIIRRLGYFREDEQGHAQLANQADIEDIPSKFGGFDDLEFDTISERVELYEDGYLDVFPPASESDEALRYLHEVRNISTNTADLLGLRWDEQETRVMFPVKGRRGELYGYSGRSVQTSFSAHHGRIRDYDFDKSLCLLGEHLFQVGRPTVVVEGLFAYAALVDAGVLKFANVMATMGSSLSVAQRDLLIDMNERVIFLYDDDKAGEVGLLGDGKHQMGALNMLRYHIPTYVGMFPPDVADVDDFTMEDVEDLFTFKDMQIEANLYLTMN